MYKIAIQQGKNEMYKKHAKREQIAYKKTAFIIILNAVCCLFICLYI